MPVAIYERAECEEMAGCAVGQAALAVGSVAVDETFSEACAAADGTNVFHDGTNIVPKTCEKFLAQQVYCGLHRF